MIVMKIIITRGKRRYRPMEKRLKSIKDLLDEVTKWMKIYGYSTEYYQFTTDRSIHLFGLVRQEFRTVTRARIQAEEVINKKKEETKITRGIMHPVSLDL